MVCGGCFDADLLGDVCQSSPSCHGGQCGGQPLEHTLRRLQLVGCCGDELFVLNERGQLLRGRCDSGFFARYQEETGDGGKAYSSPGKSPNVVCPVGHGFGRFGHVLDVVIELTAERGHPLDNVAGLLLRIGSVEAHAKYLLRVACFWDRVSG